MFGSLIYSSYLCITELVINPTGGVPSGGRVDSNLLYIFYINPEGVDIEDNGIRETDTEYRKLIDFIIVNYLKSRRSLIKNYGILEGPTEERIKQLKFQLGL